MESEITDKFDPEYGPEENADASESELSVLLSFAFDNLRWVEIRGEDSWPSFEEGGGDILETPYLCLIDWGYISDGRLTEPKPYLSVCYWAGTCFMNHDDLGVCGPVKAVRAWAKMP